MEKIALVMNTLRMNSPAVVGGLAVKTIEDYLTSKVYEFSFVESVQSKEQNQKAAWIACGEINLPKENVIRLLLDQGSWGCVRPSGTEPKLKVYVGIKGSCQDNANEVLIKVREFMLELVEQMIQD